MFFDIVMLNMLLECDVLLTMIVVPFLEKLDRKVI